MELHKSYDYPTGNGYQRFGKGGICPLQPYNNLFDGLCARFQDSIFFINILQFGLVFLMYYNVGKGRYWKILFYASLAGLIGSFIENFSIVYVCTKKDVNTPRYHMIPFFITEFFWIVKEYAIPFLNLIKIKAFFQEGKIYRILSGLIFTLFLGFIACRFYIGYERASSGLLNSKTIKYGHMAAFTIMGIADLICTCSLIYIVTRDSRNKDHSKQQQQQQQQQQQYQHHSHSNHSHHHSSQDNINCDYGNDINYYIKRSSYTILICIDITSILLAIYYGITNIFEEYFLDSYIKPFHCIKSSFILILASDALLFKYSVNTSTANGSSLYLYSNLNKSSTMDLKDIVNASNNNTSNNNTTTNSYSNSNSNTNSYNHSHRQSFSHTYYSSSSNSNSQSHSTSNNNSRNSRNSRNSNILSNNSGNTLKNSINNYNRNSYSYNIAGDTMLPRSHLSHDDKGKKRQTLSIITSNINNYNNYNNYLNTIDNDDINNNNNDNDNDNHNRNNNNNNHRISSFSNGNSHGNSFYQSHSSMMSHPSPSNGMSIANTLNSITNYNNSNYFNSNNYYYNHMNSNYRHSNALMMQNNAKEQTYRTTSPKSPSSYTYPLLNYDEDRDRQDDQGQDHEAMMSMYSTHPFSSSYNSTLPSPTVTFNNQSFNYSTSPTDRNTTNHHSNIYNNNNLPKSFEFLNKLIDQ